MNFLFNGLWGAESELFGLLIKTPGAAGRLNIPLGIGPFRGRRCNKFMPHQKRGISSGFIKKKKKEKRQSAPFQFDLPLAGGEKRYL